MSCKTGFVNWPHAKLVGFKEQKKHFAILKPADLA